MRLRIELDPELEETEVVIRTARLTEEIANLQEKLQTTKSSELIFYKDSSEFYIDPDTILFFETDGVKIYGHTREDAYEVKLKLYELEDMLPVRFCRISKSTIVNVKQIYSLDKSFSGTSTIHFYKTHKQVHVSRHYYQFLKERLKEMR